MILIQEAGYDITSHYAGAEYPASRVDPLEKYWHMTDGKVKWDN
jgi:hypothetical protein